MGTTPVYPAAPNSSSVTIVNADGTTKKTLFTAGASGSRVHALNVSLDDSGVTYSLQVWVTLGGVDYLVGTASIPSSSGGFSTTPPVNLLSLLSSICDPAGYLVLKAGAIIKINVTVAVTAAKTMYATALGADF